MAGIRQLAEDVLTCSLCLDKLRDPRTLPCLHSFCRACLGSFLATTYSGADGTSSSSPSSPSSSYCPVCQQQVHNNSQAPVEQWLECFVPNTFLSTLSRIKAARVAEKACDICRQEHVLVDAFSWCLECLEMLCQDCHRVHRRSKASRDHKLVTVDDLQNETLEKLIRPASRAPKCPDHKQNEVTMVCVDCKRAACETCVVTSHTKCRKLEKLEKMSPNLKKDVAEARRRLDACRQKAESDGDVITHQMTSLTKSKDEALDELTTIKDRLLELVHLKEEKSVASIDAAYGRQRDLLSHRKRASDVAHMALGKTNKFLDLLLTYGTDVDILNNFDFIVAHVTTVEKEQQGAAVVNRSNPTVLKFSVEKKSLDFLKNTSAFGDVKFTKSSIRVDPAKAKKEENNAFAVTPRATKPVQTKQKKGKNENNMAAITEEVPTESKPKLVSSFTGRHNSDTMKTDIRGIVVLPDDAVVVMDVHFRNKRLKKFNHRGKFISHLDPGDCPTCMTLIPDSDLVVSLYKAKEFVFVSASGTLHVTGRLKTSKPYYALASSTDGVMAAVTSSPQESCAIDLISFNGDLLHSINIDRIRFPLPPRDITMTSCGRIYLIFTGKECLASMSYEGEILFTYKQTSQHGVKRPISVECDELDNAYIADVDANAIHMINSDGIYVKTVVGKRDGLREPLALYRTDDGEMALTQSNGDVKVFKIDT